MSYKIYEGIEFAGYYDVDVYGRPRTASPAGAWSLMVVGVALCIIIAIVIVVCLSVVTSFLSPNTPTKCDVKGRTSRVLERIVGQVNMPLARIHLPS